MFSSSLVSNFERDLELVDAAFAKHLLL